MACGSRDDVVAAGGLVIHNNKLVPSTLARAARGNIAVLDERRRVADATPMPEVAPRRLDVRVLAALAERADALQEVTARRPYG